MTKVIVTADIHLDKYLKDNKYQGYRDDQFIMLAKRLIEEGKLQNTKILFIAGDLIDKPVNKPEVLHLFKRFLGVLGEYFDKIYYVLGNHDCNQRSNEEFDLSTYISLFNDDKFIYMNDKYLSYNSNNKDLIIKDKVHDDKDLNTIYIYFLDFQYEKKIIPRDCDIFISHITIDDKFGQEVDNSKFKLGLFGDIHSPIDKENYKSISSPLQRGFQDYHTGMFGVLDLDTLEYKRVATDSDNYKFMKVRRSSDPSISRIKDTENLFIREDKEVKISNKITLNNQDYTLDKVNNTKILNIIDNSIVDKFKDLHSSVKSNINFTKDDDDINLDFKIKKIKINNFRSIDSIEYDFEYKDNIYFITGENGSGKTSFLKALYLSLYSDKELKSNKKINSEGLVSTEIIFEYENKEYCIFRTEGKLKVYENDVDITPASKNTTEKYLYDLFPFMNLLYVFYMQGGESFFDKVNNIEVFNKLFNISYLTKFYEEAVNCYKAEHDKLLTIKENLIKTEGVVGAVKSDIEDIENNLKEYKDFIPTEDIDNKIKTLSDYIYEYESKETLLGNINNYLTVNKEVNIDVDINKLNKDNAEINESIRQCELDKNNIVNKISEVINISTKIDLNNKWIYENKITEDITEEDYDKHISLVSSYTVQANKYDSNLNELRELLNNDQQKIKYIEDLERELITCPNCQHKFGNNASKIESLKKELLEEDVRNSYKELITKYSTDKTSLVECIKISNAYIVMYQKNIKLMSEIKLKKATIEELQKSLSNRPSKESLEKQLETMTSTLSTYQNNLIRVNDKIRDYNDKSKLMAEIDIKKKNRRELTEWFELNNKPDYNRLTALKEEQSKLTYIVYLQDSLKAKISQLTDSTNSLTKYRSCHDEITYRLELLNDYKSLFDFNIEGSIPQKIFDYLSETISDNRIRFSTYYYRNKLNIECYLKVDDEWIKYSLLSMGQRSLIDMLLISKFNSLLGRIGVLFLDETLGHVDNSNYDELIDVIKELDVNDIFITSHLEKFNLYTKKISFNRIDNKTIIK